MCGLTGFVDHNHGTDQRVLEAMTTALAHRGPDGDGYLLERTGDATVGLGHRRLSIIDLSPAGAQPMHHGRYSVVFNGEIYNYREIRAQLEKHGRAFSSNSDTEVLLQSYAQWGDGCADRFTGMFAFAILDREKQVLFCARDRAGVKPFFYYYHNGLFLFASELKAFHRHTGFSPVLNDEAVAAFVQFGNVPGRNCIYRNCFKLEPAHRMTYDLKSRHLHTERYWSVYDAYNQPKLQAGFEEALAETETVLSKAFAYRMVADVPVGVFLSGGYDSAAVAALIQKQFSERLKTFTIAVPDIGLNEAPDARKVAAHLGTDHTEVTCTAGEAMALIAELPFYYDEPFGDSSAIPTMLVSKVARQSVKVALSGDGGDEVFAGYNRYDYVMRYEKLRRLLPPGLSKAVAGAMDVLSPDHLPFIGMHLKLPGRYEKIKQLLREPSDRNLMLSLSSEFNSEGLKTLFGRSTGRAQTAYSSTALRKEHYTALSFMMAIDYETYLTDDILQKVDRASMSVSLEAREPFLDQQVIEWAARLPDNFKYRNGEKKYILKKIVHRFIPPAIMERPKMGFAIPVAQWLSGPLRERVKHYLDDDLVAAQGLFNAHAVRSLRDRFLGGRKELALKVWYLLTFQMWREKWLDGISNP
jgi:asparagine synthase (glutamine-hydrolysing)